MHRHSLLERQIKRHLGSVDITEEPYVSFLAAVDCAYRGFDADRKMVERSMELSSEELREAGSELRAIVQAFPDLMLRVDRAGRVVAARGQGHGARWSEEAVLGRRLGDLQPGQFGAAFDEALHRTVGTRRTETLELADIEDGRQVVNEVRVAPLGAAGAIVLVRDVTDERRAAEFRRARDTAEAASIAKGAFLANVSHELRTPLNAIVGYAEMLSEDAARDGQASLLDDLGRIVTAGRHLMKIVNDVIDITRIEAGRLSVHLEALDVEAIVREVAVTLEPLIAANGNHLTTTVMPGLPPLRSDSTKLTQILINLVGNAAKFTHGGAVDLDVRMFDSPAGPEIVFEVRDTGIGIGPDQLSKLFQDFVQVDDSNTRRYGGAGLGLSISRRLCELLGGHVTVQSQLGHGTVFTIWLPLHPQNGPPDLAAEGTSLDRRAS